MGHTLVEKILAAHSESDDLAPGDIVSVRCDLVLANDVSGPVAFTAMERMGAETVFDPSRVVMVADHFMPAKDVRSAELQQRLREWSHEHGVRFFDQGRGGIEHAVLIEEGLVAPGMVIPGGDSHTCTYGALGAFGTGLGSTDIAACLALGELWLSVPGTIRVELTGSPSKLVTGKDVILAVLAEIGVDGGNETVLEFAGPGVASLTMDDRRAAANMAVEAGAETGLFPADEVTASYLDTRTDRPWTALRSDEDAELAGTVRIDLGALGPLVARPPSPGDVVPVGDVAGRRVDQVYVGNCANGTISDLRQVAAILRGRRVADGTRAIIVPSSQRVYRQAVAEGLVDVFVEAGAVVSTPTCGACFGGGMGILAPGETAVATTNRNFVGRMGADTAEVFLANAFVAAAAAVAGEITDPAELVGEGVR
ncbi:MAG: 3-isopropylmalate dehydratase large subunit [Thermoanaerobaculales bacterium]|jgi:3-isopropylmalate/(R)-2-methylmalate dehydratase large subunit|nr:3-isopropylmalate dehydratase large subunit [Thermoanaerobaculales bacterium]